MKQNQNIHNKIQCIFLFVTSLYYSTHKYIQIKYKKYCLQFSLYQQIKLTIKLSNIVSIIDSKQQNLMDNSTSYEHDMENKQMIILKFMELTQCETYDQAQFIVTMHDYNIKTAISSYLQSHSHHKNQINDHYQPLSSSSHKQSIEQTIYFEWDNHKEVSISSEQVKVLEKRLKSRVIVVNEKENIGGEQELNKRRNGLCGKLFPSCSNSFKCLTRLKHQLNRKLNSLRGDTNRIYYFHQLYHMQLQQSSLLSTKNVMIQEYQLSQIEENQKLKMLKKQYHQQCRPIFAMICSNRKGKLVEELLKNHQLMTFVVIFRLYYLQKQHFDVLFITLSELKELKLVKTHVIRKIKKCPTVVVYIKNMYDLEDVLVEFEGQKIREMTVEKLKEGLKGVTMLERKWRYLMSLQSHLRQNSITSLSQVIHQDFDSDPISISSPQSSPTRTPSQHSQTKRSLIQQQTQIYQQLVAEQSKRKNSIDSQKRRFDEIRQMREIRRMSLPEEPVGESVAESVEVRFRCPLNGEYIRRRFLRQEKVDVLYQFVDTSDNIEFQTQPQRSFDLFTSFPPRSLSQHRQSLLSQIFDQQKQTVLIRQI